MKSLQRDSERCTELALASEDVYSASKRGLYGSKCVHDLHYTDCDQKMQRNDFFLRADPVQPFFGRTHMRQIKLSGDEHPTCVALVKAATEAGFETATQLAESLGVSVAVLNNWKTRGVAYQHRVAVGIKFPSIPARVLAERPATPTISDRDGASATVFRRRMGSVDTGFRIPIVGNLLFTVEDFAPLVEYKGEAPFLDVTSRDSEAYAVLCNGNAHAPRIRSGEYVVIEPNVAVAPGDEVLIRMLDGRVTFRQFLYVRDGLVHVLPLGDSHTKTTIHEHDIEAIEFIGAFAKSTRLRH